jgi:putative heme iron utilization protein
MPVDEAPSGASATPAEPAPASRTLIRTALKASLATLDRATGHPYASLVLVATEPDGTPVFLISRLALHTRNLEKDPRASLLIDGTGGLGNPLTGGRLTLMGEARPSTSPTALRRFLARHPSAEGYAGFADFSVYALEIAGGHYIGGFGRIVDLAPRVLLTDTADAGTLIEAEPGIVAHMNSDHKDAVALYATRLAQHQAGDWRMSGIDPDGCDLLHCTNAVRIDFAKRVRSPAEARETLVALVRQARVQQQAGA